MDLSTLILRTLMIYFVVFVVLRIMGKREIGKLSVFDLVISIMIAEIAVFVLEDLEKSLLEGLLPMVILVAVQMIMAYVTLKSRRLRNLFDGHPSVLIEDGMIDRAEMKKQKYTIDDLLLQLRESGVRSVSEVDVAVLETNGKLSVIKWDQDEVEGTDRVHRPRATQTNIRLTGLPLPLIMDGEVQDKHLERIDKNRSWLKKQIKTYGASEFKQVFFCWIDHKGRLYVNLN